MPKRYIISGGGTGGHIYPAIAIADEIRRRDAHAEICFVGASGKMEMEKVPKAGYPIVGLPVRGLQRSLDLSNLALPFRLAQSLWKAWRLLKQVKPNAVIGTGGYASGAVMQAAAWLGLPTIIQEQNSYAGLTNKLLAKHARKICVAYPDMEKYFPKHKIVFCGNPVRQDIGPQAATRQAALQHFGLSPQRRTLLVIGGSLGARTLNQCIAQGLDQLLAAGHQIIWQTGKGYFAKLKADIGSREGLYLADFVYEMHLAYAAADVVVSRAGALSISEIALAHKPAILVPSPNVAEDHQTKNAQALAGKGAALLVSDQAAAEQLVGQALALLQNPAQQQALSQHIAAFAKPNAAQAIVDIILEEENKTETHTAPKQYSNV